MNFDLSEEQQLLQETVKQYIRNECPMSRLRELFDDESGWDPVLWKGLVELGVAGLHLPEEFGGAGLEVLDLALVIEVLGETAAPVPFLSHALAGAAIAIAGSAEQKAKYLPRLASGEALGTIAFGEGGGLWDPSEWQVAAGANLTGAKELVPFAQQADLFVVGLAGGGLAVVDKSAAGLTVTSVDGVDRTRRIGRIELADTPCDPLANAGLASASRVRDIGLVLLAADAFGGATALLNQCVDYAKTREQFGVTIGHFQGLKHQLANMAVEVEPARALYWYAAHALDHIAEESERSAAVAKAHITDRFMQVGRDAVEAHGGIGFTWECDVQIWFKRAMFDRAFMGAPAVHRERVVQLADW